MGKRRLDGAWSPLGLRLIALLLALFAPEPAFACACCADAGAWSRVTRKVTALESAVMGRLELAPDAALHVTAAGLEGIRGVVAPAHRYRVRLSRSNRRWTLELTDGTGGGGRLTFVVPDRAEFYAADLQDGASAGAGGPRLYKEWRFEGPLAASGRFRGNRFHLVLQARGNACPDASQFTGWILQVSGPGASYSLFGRFDDRRHHAEPGDGGPDLR